MNTPSWYALVLVSLAVFRLWRLLALDDITATLRGRITIPDEAHSQWTYVLDALEKIGADPWRYAGWHSTAFVMDAADGLGIRGDIELPPLVVQRISMFAREYPGGVDVENRPPAGGLPAGLSSQVVPFSKQRWYWSRLVHCPHCLGAHLSVAVWLAWQAAPHATLVFAVPFAVSAVVGLVAHYSAD